MNQLTLAYDEFLDQMSAENENIKRFVEWVVIRGTDGDYGVAAVHTEGNKLVFDLGHKIGRGA